MAVGDENIIEHDVVKISPDLTGFREKLIADLQKAVKGVNATVKVKLVADGAGFNASAKAALAKQAALKGRPEYKVKLVADATGFARSAKVATTLEAAGARERGRIVAEETRTRVAAERTVERAAKRTNASRAAGMRNASLTDQIGVPRLLNFGGEGLRPMNALIAAGVALSPVLIAIASNAAQAGTSIAALGTVSIGAGLAIGGLTVAFSGVTKLFAAYTAFENETIHAAANAAAQTKNQANGYNELADKMLAVSDARDNLAAAQKAETNAQKDINKARETARRDADNLRRSIMDLQNAEEGDTLTIAEAKQRAASLQADFFATAATKARANQDVRDAVNQLADDQLTLAQKRADLLKSNRQGIEGSDAVTQAKDAADAAHRSVNSAHHSLNRATKALNTTQAGQSNSVSSAQALLNEQMRRASPAARDMLGWYKANEKELQRLARVVQQGVLPGFTRFLDAIEPRKRGKGKTTLELFAEAAGQLGGIIGNVAGKVGAWTNTPFFRRAFGKIQAENAKDLTTLGKAGLTLLDPLTRIAVAAAPLAGKLADGIEKFATWFADIIKRADNSGKLAKWFDDAGSKFGVWLDIGRNLLTLLKNIFTFSLPTGDSLVQRLSNFTKAIADWSGSKDGQKSITGFFDFFARLDYGRVTTSVVALTEMFTALAIWNKVRNVTPFTLILGGLVTWSASNPKQAADALRHIADAINDSVGYLAAHPTELKFLLAAFAAAKVGKAVGFSLKLPVLDSIRTFLASKFSILEKFVGGGATTATMTVHAGVVNVNGGIGVPGGGGDVPAVVPGEKVPKEPGGVKGVARKIADGAKKIPDFLYVDLSQWADSHRPDFAKHPGMGQVLTGPDAGKWVPRKPGDPGYIPPAHLKTFNAQHTEASAWNAFGHAAAADPTLLSSGIKAKTNKQFQDYVAARKASVQALFEEEVKTKGVAAAQADLLKENAKSQTVVEKLLTSYGMGAKAAHKYATELFTLPPMITAVATATKPLNTLLDGTNTLTSDVVNCMGDFGTSLDNAAGKAAAKIPSFTSLNTVVDKLTGQKRLLLTVDGEKQVFDSLREAMDTQRALETGSTVAAAHGMVQADLDATRQRVYRAAGGPIMGPGTGTSDSIPAMLSNGEHVWTAQEVANVGGQDAMYRMRAAARTGQFRFAKGGAVTTWPFPIDVSKTLIPIMNAAGNASGDAKVSELAEATARNMGATVKQLVALIEAGLVESGLHNLSYGDRDSVGFLQQRAGWGSLKQRMDVAHATRKFIQKARSVDKAGYSAGQLAQAVQVSAFPGRYDMRYGDALAVLNQAAPYVTGMPGGGVGLGGGVGGPGWRWQESVLKAAFGKGVNFFSTTGGGHATNSWHYRGRAVDLTPSMAIFDWIKSHYGANTKELIYGPAGIGIRNGGPYDWGAQNAKHKTHIHWAFNKGGAVRARTYDGGGPLLPGYTLAYNGTGRTERVNTASQQAAQVSAIGDGTGPVRLDRRDLATLAGHIVTAMTGQTITMDGRKVAETVRGYDYLPRGL